MEKGSALEVLNISYMLMGPDNDDDICAFVPRHYGTSAYKSGFGGWKSGLRTLELLDAAYYEMETARALWMQFNPGTLETLSIMFGHIYCHTAGRAVAKPHNVKSATADYRPHGGLEILQFHSLGGEVNIEAVLAQKENLRFFGISKNYSDPRIGDFSQIYSPEEIVRLGECDKLEKLHLDVTWGENLAFGSIKSLKKLYLTYTVASGVDRSKAVKGDERAALAIAQGVIRDGATQLKEISLQDGFQRGARTTVDYFQRGPVYK
ncbi:hypothetical protein RUND412_011605, partial [Rhizina undulata]